MSWRLAALAIGLGLAAASARGAAPDIESIQAVGAVPVGKSSGSAARQAALEAGVSEAVLQVGAEVVQETGSPPDPAALKAALGSDLQGYALRFRLIEDRGEHAALLVQEPGVEREYEVLVDVEVDRARVRTRLAKAGLVKATAPSTSQRSLEIAFEGVERYATWERLQRALAERGASVRPIEFSRHRVVARVETDETPDALIERLRHAVGDSFGIARRSAPGAQLEIELLPAPAPGTTAPAASAESAAPPAPRP